MKIGLQLGFSFERTSTGFGSCRELPPKSTLGGPKEGEREGKDKGVVAGNDEASCLDNAQDSWLHFHSGWSLAGTSKDTKDRTGGRGCSLANLLCSVPAVLYWDGVGRALDFFTKLAQLSLKCSWNFF